MRTLLVVFVAAVLAVGSGAPATSARGDAAGTEAQFVDVVNRLRADKGLPPLAVDDGLVAVGRRWAARMAAVDRISHNPNLAKDVVADWEKLGENVGVGMTVDKLHRAFVASPSHYRNLVDAEFTHIGVGVVYGRGGAIFTAHQFMHLRTPPPPPPPMRATALPGEPSARLHTVLSQLHALDVS